MQGIINWYKNNPNKGIIRILIFVVIGLLLAIIATILTPNNVQDNSNVISDENLSFETIDELCNYYGIKFYSRNPSEIDGFMYDVSVRFPKPLVEEDGTSNKQFFMTIIMNMARINKYNDIRIIDRSQDITISVKCKNNVIEKILINDVENYFELQEELLRLRNFEEIPETEMEATCFELITLMRYKWSKTAIEDENYTLYNNTKQYFDKGYITKDREDRVLSIVFTNRYTKSVINDIMVNSELAYKKAVLGTPAFEDTQAGIIGYKGKDFYAFMTDSSIVIYRRLEEDYDSFINISRKLINKELTINQFVDQLTTVWPDYDTYDMETDSFLLTYPQKGIAVKYNIEGRNGIIFYNNCLLDPSIMEEFVSKSDDFILQRKTDLIEEVAINRIIKEKNEIEKCVEFQNEHKTDANPLINSKYGIYADYDFSGNIFKMNFISKDGLNPNHELIDNIYTFAWLNDDVFIYSVKNKGIYYDNLASGKRGTIKLGTDNFEIYNCYNGLLIYDNSRLIIEEGN